jgi:tripartite ATP-independent transporter DctP family solute receptor
MRTVRWGLFLSVVAFVSLLSSYTAYAQEKKIRFGSPFKPGHILVDAATKFKELVAQQSGGRIEVEVQVGTASEEQIGDWNSEGKIEMQANGHRSLEVHARPYFFFNAPYVMKDFNHFMRVWDGPLGQAARASAEKNGNVKFLGMVYRGLRQTTAKKPIYTPADVYGLKLRLPNIPTWIAIWKAVDVVPVPVTLPELYKALQEGRAEASEGDLSQITSFKLDEVQTHLIMTNHLVQTGGILINKPFFDGLPKVDQDLIVQAAKEATTWANQKLMAGEVALLVDLQRKGMHVVIPDAESFREKAKPAVEELFRKEWPVTTWAEVLAQ